ncbi:hypothetical protein EDB81DRAFT_787287 [Dactylonectria macrodidyma]|uniref:Uncharacterized protein n=1 Tax=Dactylonectria macrodidyma TaxID=307937 RepID=A0A9P9F973_9HYPO|nr:hypothetical protein EDB81DRAFT_787287 [Dactylonectria macrodidyma]
MPPQAHHDSRNAIRFVKLLLLIIVSVLVSGGQMQTFRSWLLSAWFASVKLPYGGTVPSCLPLASPYCGAQPVDKLQHEGVGS